MRTPSRFTWCANRMSIAIVFPGQGSQSVGMMSELSENFAVVGETFNQASEVLGFDLWDMIQSGPVESLNQTENTQPAMLTAGVATWRVWNEVGGELPAAMAGHSLGEYTALVCSGALEFADAVALVAERGRQMQAAVPAGTGAMAAVLGLDDEQVSAACTAAAEGQVVEAVNFNSPGQVVIAGDKAAVERAIENAKGVGAKRAMLLPVSVPSHCQLMKPAADVMAKKLSGISISKPAYQVIHNVDVQTHESADEIRVALAEQLYKPVRWVETVQALSGQGVEKLVELGPGKVLAGLTKRIDRSLQGVCVQDMATLEKAKA